jgi:hypothetical protein
VLPNTIVLKCGISEADIAGKITRLKIEHGLG